MSDDPTIKDVIYPASRHLPARCSPDTLPHVHYAPIFTIVNRWRKYAHRIERNMLLFNTGSPPLMIFLTRETRHVMLLKEETNSRGPHPIVVGYASSPPAEGVFADPPIAQALTQRSLCPRRAFARTSSQAS
jgi:hypothetical protein